MTLTFCPLMLPSLALIEVATPSFRSVYTSLLAIVGCKALLSFAISLTAVSLLSTGRLGFSRLCAEPWRAPQTCTSACQRSQLAGFLPAAARRGAGV